MPQVTNFVITTVGRNALINAAKTGTNTLQLTHIAFGSRGYKADASATALKNEFKRVQVRASSKVGDGFISVNAIENSSDSYSVYEIGIFATLDDETDPILFALYADTSPILEKTSAGEAAVDFDLFIGSDAEGGLVDYGDPQFNVSTATTTHEGVVRFATVDEATSGSSTTAVLSPATLNKALSDTSDTNVVYSAIKSASTEAASAFLKKQVVRTDISQGLTEEQMLRSRLNQGVGASGLYTSKGVGVPGEPGFGCGPCTTIDPLTLSITHGFTPLPGCDDPLSPNYGNYRHRLYGICVYIPKFWIKGDPALAVAAGTPDSYMCTSSFASTSEATAAGYALPRAFIDGGAEQDGFFIQKYLPQIQSIRNGISGTTADIPVSIPNENPVVNITAAAMIDCARNGATFFNVASCFQLAALDMLMLCHAIHSSSTKYCAWWRSDGNSSARSGNSGSPLSSHNGQACGVNGYHFVWELGLGVTTAGTSADQSAVNVTANTLYVMQQGKKLADFTSGFGGATDAWGPATNLAAGMYAAAASPVTLVGTSTQNWGNGNNAVLGSGDLMGVFPAADSALSSSGTNLMACSKFYLPCAQNLALYFHGRYGAPAELAFARYLHAWRSAAAWGHSFRAAGYAPA